MQRVTSRFGATQKKFYKNKNKFCLSLVRQNSAHLTKNEYKKAYFLMNLFRNLTNNNSQLREIKTNAMFFGEDRKLTVIISSGIT